MPLYSWNCGNCGHTYKTISAVEGPDPGCNACGTRDNQTKQISKPQSPKMNGYKEWGYNKYTKDFLFSGDGRNTETEYDHREVDARVSEVKKKIEGQGTKVAIKKNPKKVDK